MANGARQSMAASYDCSGSGSSCHPEWPRLWVHPLIGGVSSGEGESFPECMPGPLRRIATSCFAVDSIMPLPIRHPAARQAG